MDSRVWGFYHNGGYQWIASVAACSGCLFTPLPHNVLGFVDLWTQFSSQLTTPASKKTTQIYVADHGGSQVQIIDVNRDPWTASSSIFGFDHPRVVKVTPDGTKAYVGDDGGKLWQINTSSHEVMASLDIPHPVALAITPDSQFLYVASSNDTVTKVKIADFTIQSILTGFASPQDIKITPNGTLAYITNGANGTMSVIRVLDDLFLSTIDGMHKPVGFAFTRDGNFIYVTDPQQNLLYIVSVRKNRVIQEVLGFNIPRYIAMAPQGDFAYISNGGNNSVSSLRLEDNQIIQSLPIPSPRSLIVSLDGKYLYVSSDAGAIYKISISNGNILSVIASFENPTNMAITQNHTSPPVINGCQTNGPQEILNHLHWIPAPGTPVSYKIYQDVTRTRLLATLDGYTTGFSHYDIKTGQTYWYYLEAVYPNGFTSTLGSIIVSPKQACQEGY
jgi:DNA-binding beta-propeller fold protein YncE